ncbi:FCD domain-containing protein [uncultured Alistipes sp.]|jgi:transcriptional regulator|uniref:FadR/GntR family transcriptional regulator n=1 Tax=uncultured Alistipes sp. TaxID=538949 RepID=UPI0025CCD54C|nr:FCD domain-containing protein [uncultured Alistipes sp.]
MNYSPNIKQVETVIKYIKEQLYTGRLQPGERLPAERRLAERLDVGRAHVRAALQKLEFYGIVQTFPQSGTVVAQEKMQVLERMITDALQIEQYDFASLVYVRVLLEIEAIKLCARNRTPEDIVAIEQALAECEANFYTDERVSKDFAYHQALARGAHNPVIASLLLVITPDVLRYYQRYRVCSVPSEDVCHEHRELLRCVRERDEEGAAEMLRLHLRSLREFAQTNNDENHFLE